jgi:hypothetical protein
MDVTGGGRPEDGEPSDEESILDELEAREQQGELTPTETLESGSQADLTAEAQFTDAPPVEPAEAAPPAPAGAIPDLPPPHILPQDVLDAYSRTGEAPAEAVDVPPIDPGLTVGGRTPFVLPPDVMEDLVEQQQEPRQPIGGFDAGSEQDLTSRAHFVDAPIPEPVSVPEPAEQEPAAEPEEDVEAGAPSGEISPVGTFDSGSSEDITTNVPWTEPGVSAVVTPAGPDAEMVEDAVADGEPSVDAEESPPAEEARQPSSALGFSLDERGQSTGRIVLASHNPTQTRTRPRTLVLGIEKGNGEEEAPDPRRTRTRGNG